MDTFYDIAIITTVVVVALILIGVAAMRLYHRASKETAFVRTGARGAKVVMDGGAIIIPVLHETIPVSLKTHKLTVKKTQAEALITNDSLRVDVIADFYVRVARDNESIQAAAATLGTKASDPAALQDLVDSKFVDGLRSVAASMAMKDLHLKRSEFVQKVQDTVAEDLKKNGLELESVSLTALDQTDEQYFNENNAFDSEGLRILKSITEANRVQRNDIEQEAAVSIEKKNLDTTKRALELRREAVKYEVFDVRAPIREALGAYAMHHGLWNQNARASGFKRMWTGVGTGGINPYRKPVDGWLVVIGTIDDEPISIGVLERRNDVGTPLVWSQSKRGNTYGTVEWSVRTVGFVGFYVRKEHRGNGIARKMRDTLCLARSKELMEECADWGDDDIVAVVATGNAIKVMASDGALFNFVDSDEDDASLKFSLNRLAKDREKLGDVPGIWADWDNDPELFRERFLAMSP